MIMKMGTIIKKRRIAMRLTQEELACKLNVTPQAVSRWENEVSLPDITLIPKISEVLELSCDILLKGTDERSIQYAQSGVFAENVDIMIQNDIDMLFGFCKREEKTDHLHVLHADDSDFMRSMVKDIFYSQGYDVIEAKDGVECMDILLKIKPDILLLDINMPGYNGLEVLELVRKEYSDIPVLMLSAMADSMTVQKAYCLGARGFVSKPFRPEDLLEHLTFSLSNI